MQAFDRTTNIGEKMTDCTGMGMNSLFFDLLVAKYLLRSPEMLSKAGNRDLAASHYVYKYYARFLHFTA